MRQRIRRELSGIAIGEFIRTHVCHTRSAVPPPLSVIVFAPCFPIEIQDVTADRSSLLFVGVILFFTCLSAVVGPLAMGAVSDAMGYPKYGFILATGFAGLLFAPLVLNWLFDPTRDVLRRVDDTEY